MSDALRDPQPEDRPRGMNAAVSLRGRGREILLGEAPPAEELAESAAPPPSQAEGEAVLDWVAAPELSKLTPRTTPVAALEAPPAEAESPSEVAVALAEAGTAVAYAAEGEGEAADWLAAPERSKLMRSPMPPELVVEAEAETEEGEALPLLEQGVSPGVVEPLAYSPLPDVEALIPAVPELLEAPAARRIEDAHGADQPLLVDEEALAIPGEEPLLEALPAGAPVVEEFPPEGVPPEAEAAPWLAEAVQGADLPLEGVAEVVEEAVEMPFEAALAPTIEETEEEEEEEGGFAEEAHVADLPLEDVILADLEETPAGDEAGYLSEARRADQPLEGVAEVVEWADAMPPEAAIVPTIDEEEEEWFAEEAHGADLPLEGVGEVAEEAAPPDDLTPFDLADFVDADERGDFAGEEMFDEGWLPDFEEAETEPTIYDAADEEEALPLADREVEAVFAPPEYAVRDEVEALVPAVPEVLGAPDEPAEGPPEVLEDEYLSSGPALGEPMALEEPPTWEEPPGWEEPPAFEEPTGWDEFATGEPAALAEPTIMEEALWVIEEEPPPAEEPPSAGGRQDRPSAPALRAADEGVIIPQDARIDAAWLAPVAPRPPSGELFGGARAIQPDAALLERFVTDERLEALLAEISALQDLIVERVQSDRQRADVYQQELLQASALLLQNRANYDDVRAIVYRVRADLARDAKIALDTARYRPQLIRFLVFAFVLWAVLMALEPAFRQLMGNIGLESVSLIYHPMLFGMLGAVVNAYFTLHKHTVLLRDFDAAHVSWYLMNPLVGAVMGLLMTLVFWAGVISISIGAPGVSDVMGPYPFLLWALCFVAGFSQNVVLCLLDRAFSFLRGGRGASAGGQTP